MRSEIVAAHLGANQRITGKDSKTERNLRRSIGGQKTIEPYDTPSSARFHAVRNCRHFPFRLNLFCG